MHPISLHQIVAPEITPVELVGIAGRLSCPYVCLWTQTAPGGWRFPVVEAADAASVRQALAENGVTANAVTSFPVRPEVSVSSYEPALERGASLGATYANVQIFELDENRAIDGFAHLAELATQYGLTASIEFMAFKKPDILDRTLRILDAAGKGALTIDPLHIVRSGVSLDALRSVAPSRIGNAQLCDGPLQADETNYGYESAADRLPPGEGEFPLRDIIALIPKGRPVSLEVPNVRLRELGINAETRCSRAVESTRQLFKRLKLN